MENLSGLAGMIAILAIYFIPAGIAASRHHHQSTAIFWLNLLAGWTALGWLIAFVWSLTAVNRDLQADSKMACPHCAEPIMRAAKVCKHCGRDIQTASRLAQAHQAPPTPRSLATPSKLARAQGYGMDKVNGKWMFEGQAFSNLDVALKYADARVRSDGAT